MSDLRSRLYALSLLDQVARLDALYETAEHRATRSLKPLLTTLRHQGHALATTLLAADDAERLAAVAEGIALLHRRLDHVPGVVLPVESDHFLHDLLDSPAGPTPPIVLSHDPTVGSVSFGGDQVSLRLPLVYRDHPLAWTLLAGELGHWLSQRHGVRERLWQARRTDLSPATVDRLTLTVADLIAVRLAGPAYLAALTGTGLMQVPAARLTPLVAALQAQGFPPAAYQTWQPGPEAAAGDADPPDVIAEALAALPDLPTWQAADWATAKALIQPLSEGLLISAAPRPPQAEQQARLAAFHAQRASNQPASATELLGLLADRPNAAVTILNAGWLHRSTTAPTWYDDVRRMVGTIPEKLAYYRHRAGAYDQVLQKSIETAGLHRVMQEAP